MKRVMWLLRWNVCPRHTNGLQLTAFDVMRASLTGKNLLFGGWRFCRGRRGAGNGCRCGFRCHCLFRFLAAELMSLCHQHRLSIAELMLANEKVWRNETEIAAGIERIWHTMQAYATWHSAAGVYPVV